MKMKTEVHIELPAEWEAMFEEVEMIIVPKEDQESGVIVFSRKEEDGTWSAVLYAIEWNAATNLYSLSYGIEEYQFRDRAQMTTFIEHLTELSSLEFWLQHRRKEM